MLDDLRVKLSEVEPDMCVVHCEYTTASNALDFCSSAQKDWLIVSFKERLIGLNLAADVQNNARLAY